MEKRSQKHFKVRKMFSSLLLSYGALLIVPFWIVFTLLYLWNTSTENYYKEIVSNNLTERRMDFEKKLDVLQTGASSLFYDSLLGLVCSLEGLQPGDVNVNTLLKFSDKLNEAFVDSSKYYDYCVILKNELVFRRPSMYVGREFFYEHFRNYAKTEYEEWLERSFQAETWQLFPMDEIKLGDTTVEAMTYSYPIRTGFRQGGEADAVVQFLLPKQELESMFSVLGDMQGIVYIFSADGTLLAEISGEDTEISGEGEEISEEGMGTSGEGEETEGTLTLEDLPETGEGRVLERNGTKKLVMSQCTTDGSIVFAVMLPAEVALMNLEHTKRMAGLVLAASVLFELMLGFRFAMRFSGPIKNLLENMKRMFGADEGEKEWKSGSQKKITEYQFLEANIHALMNTNRSMKHVLQEKNVKEKVNFLALLFGGEFEEDRDAEEEAAYVGVDLSAPCYYVLIVYLKKGIEKAAALFDMNTSSREEVSAGGNSPSCIKANYVLDENRVAFLVACDTMESEETERGRGLLTESLRAQGLDYLYMGIGRIYGEKREIAFSFRQAAYCVDRAIRGNMQPGGGRGVQARPSGAEYALVSGECGGAAGECDQARRCGRGEENLRHAPGGESSESAFVQDCGRDAHIQHYVYALGAV